MHHLLSHNNTEAHHTTQSIHHTWTHLARLQQEHDHLQTAQQALVNKQHTLLQTGPTTFAELQQSNRHRHWLDPPNRADKHIIQQTPWTPNRAIDTLIHKHLQDYYYLNMAPTQDTHTTNSLTPPHHTHNTTMETNITDLSPCTTTTATPSPIPQIHWHLICPHTDWQPAGPYHLIFHTTHQTTITFNMPLQCQHCQEPIPYPPSLNFLHLTQIRYHLCIHCQLHPTPTARSIIQQLTNNHPQVSEPQLQKTVWTHPDFDKLHTWHQDTINSYNTQWQVTTDTDKPHNTTATMETNSTPNPMIHQTTPHHTPQTITPPSPNIPPSDTHKEAFILAQQTLVNQITEAHITHGELKTEIFEAKRTGNKPRTQRLKSLATIIHQHPRTDAAKPTIRTAAHYQQLTQQQQTQWLEQQSNEQLTEHTRQFHTLTTELTQIIDTIEGQPLWEQQGITYFHSTWRLKQPRTHTPTKTLPPPHPEEQPFWEQHGNHSNPLNTPHPQPATTTPHTASQSQPHRSNSPAPQTATHHSTPPTSRHKTLRTQAIHTPYLFHTPTKALPPIPKPLTQGTHPPSTNTNPNNKQRSKQHTPPGHATKHTAHNRHYTLSANISAKLDSLKLQDQPTQHPQQPNQPYKQPTLHKPQPPRMHKPNITSFKSPTHKQNHQLGTDTHSQPPLQHPITTTTNWHTPHPKPWHSPQPYTVTHKNRTGNMQAPNTPNTNKAATHPHTKHSKQDHAHKSKHTPAPCIAHTNHQAPDTPQMCIHCGQLSTSHSHLCPMANSPDFQHTFLPVTYNCTHCLLPVLSSSTSDICHKHPQQKHNFQHPTIPTNPLPTEPDKQNPTHLSTTPATLQCTKCGITQQTSPPHNITCNNSTSPTQQHHFLPTTHRCTHCLLPVLTYPHQTTRCSRNTHKQHNYQPPTEHYHPPEHNRHPFPPHPSHHCKPTSPPQHPTRLQTPHTYRSHSQTSFNRAPIMSADTAWAHCFHKQWQTPTSPPTPTTNSLTCFTSPAQITHNKLYTPLQHTPPFATSQDPTTTTTTDKQTTIPQYTQTARTKPKKRPLPPSTSPPLRQSKKAVHHKTAQQQLQQPHCLTHHSPPKAPKANKNSHTQHPPQLPSPPHNR